MKTLYLLRHAKSPRSVPGGSDRERPLKKRGFQQALAMAGQVAALLPAPEVVCCSPSLRTRQTLPPFLEVWGIDPDAVRFEEDLYDASAKKLAAFVGALPDSADLALLVGHNPGLTQLANAFSATELHLSNLPPGGFLQIDFEREHWADIRRGTGHVKLNLRPNELEQ